MSSPVGTVAVNGGQCGVACLLGQIKMMDFGSGQGGNHSDTLGIARIYNTPMAQKTHFYVPDSV
jgi:hypothetical protein